MFHDGRKIPGLSRVVTPGKPVWFTAATAKMHENRIEPRLPEAVKQTGCIVRLNAALQAMQKQNQRAGRRAFQPGDVEEIPIRKLDTFDLQWQLWTLPEKHRPDGLKMRTG
jgi:hypothetical protein